MTWVRDLPWREPDTVLALWGHDAWCTLLDSGGTLEARSRWRIFCRRPRHVLTAWPTHAQCDGVALDCKTPHEILDYLRNILPHQAGHAGLEPAGLPFVGGLVGFAGYGFGLGLEGVPSRHEGAEEPWLAAALYDHAFLWDRQEKRCYIAGFSINGLDDEACGLAVAQWCALPVHAMDLPPMPDLPLAADQSPQDYCKMVARARDYIAAGDIFQVNITARHTVRVPASLRDVDIYRHLRRHAPAPFGAYLSCGPDFALLSCSPERFLNVSSGGEITSRPIKGTAPRGATAHEDEKLERWLAQNEKECAENLMIVDLMRHDIGRVAEIGSVRVPEFLHVERFAHVHHLVSEVRGMLKAGHDVFDLLAATLPPGSVTGAPKHRAVEIIDELEASARGAYCGTVFRIGCDGGMDSSVIIRSFARTGQVLAIGTGGGITILSDPQKEYEEMCLKLVPFTAFAQQA
ncbi:MAG: anthranilate synthase component I family protein [Acetobacter sp.]